MAFQVGTRVDPRLGALDFSGFTNAANIQAASLAQLGQSIGEGFEKYRENKEITAASLSALEAISVARPEVYQQLRDSDTDIAKKIKNLEDGNYKAKDAQQVVGALQTLITAQDAQQASDLRDMQAQQTQLEIDKAQREEEAAVASATAFNQAILNNTIVDGQGLDTKNILNDYVSAGGRNPDDLKIFNEIQKLDGPNIEVINIDGFKVVTQDGRYMTASKNGQDANVAAIKTLEFKLEQRKEARKLYGEGKEQEADDILAANGYKDEFGRPLSAKKAFGPKENDNDNSDNSSGNPLPIPGNVSVEDFRNEFLTP
ncbi:MAG: hypothetical protein CML17_06825 [Pusillimonas sp.]|jgi:hypothetical protein|nr:hypothetical protein [Pusillimonas sp.]|tara:strand:- start:515 stop:1459 length:945 start_codon:yes stop_codon:yes gene_type:complete